MRFAQIQNNKIHWIFEAEEMPEFADNIAILDITDYPQVQEGWGFVDGEFIDPTPTFDELKTAKADEIAAARYTTANGYLTVKGNTYNIDTDSRLAFLGASKAIEEGLLTSVQWKTKEGFVTLSAEDFTLAAIILFVYTEACFDYERVLQAQIQGATTEAELEAIVWVAPDVSEIIDGISGGNNPGIIGEDEPVIGVH